ncbi:MAG: ATP-binding cassette domain-containing protein [Alphaproteobacteria bacterium]|nr:ATP-binding cassette domain-containing protein [Alphaproteobacteria bacterium]
MTVIHVENLGKRYRLGEKKKERYETFRNMLLTNARLTLKRLTGNAPPHQVEDFWALRNVTFDVKQGERLGIIGRNGAGKSTLLKVLSRITDPTEGRIALRGRISSLLEVGTGFHPELTGRENIFLNGAVLGMSHAEMRRKFDEIVSFAEVEAFLDTPVKRYSSGMYVRLAFAVAAHLEPEVLIVDEVLAVGDAAFQKKSLSKMEDAGRDGRTVLFVSHNMNAIQQLCTRALWLEKGKIAMDSADTHAVASAYLFGQTDKQVEGAWLASRDGALENEYFRLNGFRLLGPDGQTLTRALPNNVSATVEIDLEVKRTHPSLNFGYVLFDENGQTLYWSATTDKAEEDWPRVRVGPTVLRSSVPARLLNEGLYKLDFFASIHAQGYLSEPGNTPVSVYLNIMGGLSESPYWRDPRTGVIAPVLTWEGLP